MRIILFALPTLSIWTPSLDDILSVASNSSVPFNSSVPSNSSIYSNSDDPFNSDAPSNSSFPSEPSDSNLNHESIYLTPDIPAGDPVSCVYQNDGCSDDPQYTLLKGLEQFTEELRFFINVNGFMLRDFLLFKQGLSQQLKALKTEVSNMTYPDKPLSDQLDLAQKLFKLMSDGAELILFCNQDNDACFLVRQVIQLNIVLFWLHTEEGNPDTLIQKHPGILSRIEKMLKGWGNLFRDVVFAPFGLSLIFEGQYSRAYKTLQVMTNTVPSGEW